MKKVLLFLLCCVAIGASSEINFDQYFDGRTLRVDYTFAGDSARQEIFVSEYVSLPTWAGRRVNLDTLLLEGTGDITMRSIDDGKKIYCNSFSTHFQDWSGTPQALTLKCAYEHVVLLPMHQFDPKDIMVRDLGSKQAPDNRYLVKSGTPEECIDLAILAEGYTKDELPLFYQDAQRMTDELFKYEPFKSNKHRFNVLAVGAESQEAGRLFLERMSREEAVPMPARASHRASAS